MVIIEIISSFQALLVSQSIWALSHWASYRGEIKEKIDVMPTTKHYPHSRILRDSSIL